VANRVIHGDCIDVMESIDAASVDAIVTDPPYGLGFMGKAWDELPPGVAWAEACLRVLKPGGHLLAFGGTRTYHRLACAVEDAGFEIRDSLIWLHGQGFPKSLNVGKALKQREGWGTALKPAHEPIVVARKPLAGTVAQNVLEHGVGALNVDGCRIAATAADVAEQRSRTGGVMGVDDGRAIYGAGKRGPAGNELGRWPANVLLSHDDRCNGECFEGCPVAELDRQSGIQTSGVAVRTNGISDAGMFGFGNRGPEPDVGYGDRGGASRFFYTAKASPSERSAGLDGRNIHPTCKPIDVMRWLVRLVAPPGGMVLDPFAGSGTTGCAAALEGTDFIGIEREAEYVELARARVAHWAPRQHALFSPDQEAA
jgi:DNA modification methylase